MAEQQEGIPIAPTKREYTEDFQERATDIVVDAGQQLHFLGQLRLSKESLSFSMMRMFLRSSPVIGAIGLLNVGRIQESIEMVERISLKRDRL